MAFDFTPWIRTFEPDANDLDAKACKTTAGRVANFKRRHGLPRDQRLSPDARALLALDLETAERVAKGRQLERIHALDLIVQRATPERCAAIAKALPRPARIGGSWFVGCDSRIDSYLLNRAEILTGKRYIAPHAACRWAATIAPAAAAVAAEIQHSNTCKAKGRAVADRLVLRLFWGVVLRLDQLEGPPPADWRDFYRWSQLEAYEWHYRPGASLGDVMARLQEEQARQLLQLPVLGTLEPDAIRSAFRAQARHHHPDAGGDRHRFEQLAAARDRLLLQA